MIVKTYKQGCRRVELCGKRTMNNDPSRWKYCMYRMPKDTDMIDDLIVTGGHSILVNWSPADFERQSQLYCRKRYNIADKYLLLAAASNRFEKINDTKQYTYYHLVLDDEGDRTRDYGIWSNGVLTESQSREHLLGHQFDVVQDWLTYKG